MNFMIESFNSIEDIQNLLIYFLIYSIGGWLLESIYKTIYEKKLVNSGFLYGPFCPIYGFGTIGIIIFISPFKGNHLSVILLSFFIMSIWEYIVGVWLEKKYQTSYWDYSNYKFNINGKVCLRNSLFWAALGWSFVEFLHPFIESNVTLLDSQIKIWIIIIMYFGIFIDFEISDRKVNGINNNLIRLEELTERIKEKVDDLKEIGEKSKDKYVQKVQDSINELKEKQIQLTENIAKKMKRLNKAFPKMNSQRIKKYLDILNENIKIKK